MPCSVRCLVQWGNSREPSWLLHAWLVIWGHSAAHRPRNKKIRSTEVAFSKFRDPIYAWCRSQDTDKTLIGIWQKFSPKMAKVRTDLHKNYTPMCTPVSQESALWWSVLKLVPPFVRHYCSGSMCSSTFWHKSSHISIAIAVKASHHFLHAYFFNGCWSHAVVLYTISSSWGVPLFGSTALNNRTSWLPFCKISEPSSVSTHFSTWCCSVLMT